MLFEGLDMGLLGELLGKSESEKRQETSTAFITVSLVHFPRQ